MTEARATSSWDAEMTKLGAEGAIDILCRGLAEAVHASPYPPTSARVRFGCASIEVRWPVTPGAEPRPDAGPVPEEPARPGARVVRSELVGTFYRTPEPGAQPFVEVGDLVEAERQVAVIETMKLMTPVFAGVDGRVAEILAGHGKSIEYDQPLLVIEPAPR